MSILAFISCEYIVEHTNTPQDICFVLSSASTGIYIETLNSEKFPITSEDWHEPYDMVLGKRLKPFKIKTFCLHNRTAPIITISTFSYTDRVSGSFYDDTILFPETLRQLKNSEGNLTIRTGKAITIDSEAIVHIVGTEQNTSISHVDEISILSIQTNLVDGELKLSIDSNVSSKVSQGFIIHEK